MRNLPLFLFFAFIIFISCNKNDSLKNPNFILILSDDQGWNGTSYEMISNQVYSKSDYYETPNIENLAKSGMVFSRAYSPGPTCSPSRYAIQFGQTPARLKHIRVSMNVDHIDHLGMISIPRALKEIDNRYVAGHFGKFGMYSEPKNFGYDFSDGMTGNIDGNIDGTIETKWLPQHHEDPKQIFGITNRSLSFMENQVKENNPFYLQVSHYAVHSDLVSRKEVFDKYKKKKRGVYHENPSIAAMTEDLDFSVGEILKKVKELGIEDNTYIIYMSDNGAVEQILGSKKTNKKNKGYNYPLRHGKGTLYEGGIRVPFIISGPNIKPGSSTSVSISGVDILPTIQDLASDKLNLNEKMDGGSFKKNLFNDVNSKIIRNNDFLVFHLPFRRGSFNPHSAIIENEFKLIKFTNSNKLLLFNLENDINEKNDLSEQFPEITKKLNILLEEYLKDVKAPKWKKGINWRPFKKTLKEFNSFY